MTYKDKIRTLEEVEIKVREGYFEPYFRERAKEFKKQTPKDIVEDFLQCRIIELETDKSY